MAWIESHQELRDHPKTIRLATRLGVHRMQAVGHLHALWWWCLAYADTGDLTEFEDAEIAVGAGWDDDPGDFVAALSASGWLDGDRSVHDWHEYAGKLVEKRRADAERKAAARRQESTPSPRLVQRTSNGQSPDGAGTQPNRTVPNQTPPTPPLPAEQWARRWCEVAGLQPTRSVLRFLIPKVQEFIKVAGEPSDELLVRAHERGIVHPGGWGFVAGGKREPIPDWARELSL